MRRKAISMFLIVCMILSMLPSAAFATEAEPVYTESLTLPVVPEGEELPEPQGYGGGVSTFSLIPNNTSYAYAYEGISNCSLYHRGYFTFTVAEGVTPTKGGVLQVVDANGNVLAGSSTLSYYEDNDTENLWRFYSAYFNDESADAGHQFANVPAGEYTLQVAVGEERYTVDQKLCVVDSGSLLIKGLDTELYYDSQTAEVYLQICGLKSEEDLAQMSLTLTDTEGTVIASSTGAYRDFDYNESYGYWTFYMELAVAEGKQLQYQEDGMGYSLTISDTSQRTLVDGVGGVTAYPMKHSITLGDVQFSDAQRGVLAVELLYPQADATYDVLVTDDYNQETIYGSWSGVVPEDGLIIIPLTLNGVEVTADSYPSSFYVSYKLSSYNYWQRKSVDNPYDNYDSGDASFNPYTMSPATTQQTFMLSLNSFDAYKGDGTDVLTMCDYDGNEVARCSSFEEDWNGSWIYLTGTLSITGELTEGESYEIFLNGEQVDWISVTNELYLWSRNIKYYDYNNRPYTIWTNFGTLPVSAEVLNSSGAGEFQLRDAAGKVCVTTGPMTKSAGKYTGYVRYEGAFEQEDLAAYADTELYLWYVDGTETKEYEDAYTYDDTVSDIVFYSNVVSNSDYNVSFDWWDLDAGDSTLYFYNRDTMRNVSQEALMDRLGDLSLVCGETTLTVTDMTPYSRDNYHRLTLSAPITAGDWIVYDGTTELYTFDVEAPDDGDRKPYISSVNTDVWYVRGYYLPADSAYTAKLYQNYTCLTKEAFTLTLVSGEGDNQYLRLPKSVVTGLERGAYELRVYQDGALLGSASFSVDGALQPTITIRDNFGYNYSDRIIHGGRLSFEVSGTHSWAFYRATEDKTTLEEAEWDDLDYSYRLTDTETVGERTIYVQLSTDKAGTTVSDVMEISFFYLGKDNLMDVYVHEDVEGLFSGDYATLSLGADSPYAHAMVELVDGDGSVKCVQLGYQGKGELPSLNKGVMESAHPYSASMDQTWNYTLPGAENIAVTFSSDTYVQWYYDFIYVYYVKDGEDVLYNRYTEDELAGVTLTLPGDTVKVRLTSSNYDQYYGFKVVSVVDPNAVSDVGSETVPTYYIYSTELETADYLGTEKLRFYLVENKSDDDGQRYSLVSEVVERSLIFGDPTAVILPQFTNYGYKLINTSDYTLYGYGIPGSTVAMTYTGEDGNLVTLGTATAGTNGKFTIELTDLEDGIYKFEVVSETTATWITGKGELEVDTIPPEITAMGFAFSDSDTATLNWTCKDEDLDHSIVYLVTESGERRLGYVYPSSGKDGVFSMTVTASNNDGQRFKVLVEDEAGNTASRTISTSDQEAPTAPGELTYTARTAASVTLSWTPGKDNVGVAGYTIYKDGEKIGQTTGESVLTYKVTGLEQGTEYTFSVATRDLAGNLSDTSNPELKVSTAQLSVDATLPGTATPDDSDAVSVAVSATLSSDVEDYIPTVENLYILYQVKGDQEAPVEDQWIDQRLFNQSLTGSQGKGTWNIEVPADEDLPLTYWVKVVAADGDGVTAYSDVKTLTLADGRVTFAVKDSKTLETIPGASVSVYQDGKLKLSGTADSEGKVLFGLEDGSYSLVAQANGYRMRSIPSVTISEDKLEFTVYMNTEDILQVETTVKEMTYDEIVAAGIDPAAAGNQQVYQCTAVLDFTPIHYICVGDQVVQGDPVQVGDYIVYPAARDIFLIVPTQTTWLKEMFDVQLLVTNSSAIEDVENCVASLNLPEGLSLAEMSTGTQSEIAQLGTIIPGGSASHHWYVRGDAEGEYNLQGTVTGKRVGGGLSEDISVGFTTQKPISVLAGSAMKLTIEAEKTATVGQPYNMRFTLQNVSNKSLYNVNFDVLGGTFRQAYTIDEVLASYDLEGPFQPDADNSYLKNGFVLSAAEFKPTDVLSGVFTITFAQGIDDPDAVKYMLKQVFLFTGAGSTTVIPTEVILVDSISDHVHTYDDGVVTTVPTCTETGVKTFTCTDTTCGDTITVELPATGHSMGEWEIIKAATCTEDGSAESSCTNEGCTYKDTMVLNAPGHDYAEEWTTDDEATCTTNGSKSHHCERCGDKADVTEIPYKGHSFGDWEKHDADQHKHTCTVESCKFVEYADHTWSDWTTTTAPTCTVAGEERRDCDDCEAYETKPVAATDHDWDDGVVTKEPTVDEEGVRTYTCTVCGETKTESIAKLQKQEMYFSVNLLEQDMVKTYGDPKFIDMLFNDDVDEPVLTFASSNVNVATVDEDGWVTIKGAGTAIISATSAAVPDQYVETTASYKLVVNKADLTITANDASITYGETFAPNGYTASGFVYGEDASVLSGEAVHSCDYAQYANVGEYPIGVNGITSDNYNITFTSGKLTVSKATDYTITFDNLSQKSDNVTAVTTAIAPQDATAEIKLEYKVGDLWTTTLPTAVGTYPVRAQLTDSTNIVLDGKLYGDQLVIEAVNSIGGISVSVQTEGENATVEVTDEEVAQIVESLKNTNGDLAVNLESVEKDTLTLPGNLIEELNESDDLDTVTVTTGNSSISMSDSVLSTMADAMDREDTVSLQMATKDMDELDQAQKDALESIGGPGPNTVVLELKLTVTAADGSVKKEIKELGDKVEITVQCSQEMQNKRVVACYISPDGTVTYLVAKYDEATNTLNFKTDHFSIYAAVELSEDMNVVYVVDENGVEQPAAGAGPQAVGASVTIQAPDAPSGYRFSSWQVVEGAVTLTNVSSASTTFTMPDEDVVLKVLYNRKSSGVSGGSGSYMPTYDLTVNKTSNGTVALSDKNASEGSTVTITIYPDKGYELDKLVVLDKNGDEVKVTKQSDSYTFTMPSSNVTIEATFAEMGDVSKNPFVDVAEGEYYYDAVLWAVENGITGGTSDTTFSPAATCTRAQTVTFLWRVAGSPKPTTTVCHFEDVAPSDYYYDAVLWAVEKGITSGTSATTFSPSATVTRAQNVTFLWRLAKSPVAAKSNRFSDVARDAYYHDAVVWAAEEGITAGTTATTFGPNDLCLRSQIMTFLYHYAKD